MEISAVKTRRIHKELKKALKIAAFWYPKKDSRQKTAALMLSLEIAGMVIMDKESFDVEGNTLAYRSWIEKFGPDMLISLARRHESAIKEAIKKSEDPRLITTYGQYMILVRGLVSLCAVGRALWHLHKYGRVEDRGVKLGWILESSSVLLSDLDTHLHAHPTFFESLKQTAYYMNLRGFSESPYMFRLS